MTRTLVKIYLRNKFFLISDNGKIPRDEKQRIVLFKKVKVLRKGFISSLRRRKE